MDLEMIPLCVLLGFMIGYYFRFRDGDEEYEDDSYDE
jgi:hypothetical protein